MVLLAFICFFIAYVVEAGYACLAAQLVDQLALPEKHNVLLRFFGFFLLIELSMNSSEASEFNLLPNSNPWLRARKLEF